MTSLRFLPRTLPPTVAALLVLLSGDRAFAQNIAASGGQPYPNRVVNGDNLGVSNRPPNLAPLGVSRADCMSDMTLEFSVTLSGFTGTDSVEVWGSKGSDCTRLTDRGIGATSAVCWGLAGNLVDPIVNTPQAVTFNVRVQDLVGWQQTPPSVTVAAAPPAQGPKACDAQPTMLAVPMNINFLAVDASGNSDGTPFQYSILTDTVPPPAPANPTLSTDGPELLASWTPNTDQDTIGYEVFFGSAPASDAQAGCSAVQTTLVGGSYGVTVAGGSVGSTQVGPAESNTEDALLVSAVDGLGNDTRVTSPVCDAVGTVEADPSDEAKAPGLACAVASPGEPSGPSAPSVVAPLLGLLAIAWGTTRRSRRA